MKTDEVDKPLDLVYAEKWRRSSRLFEENGCYRWMSSKVKDYKTILEIGCGSGSGTLALTKDGHEVVVVEENRECISMTQKLLQDNGCIENVSFLEGDIVLSETRNIITKDKRINAVVCWNPGTQLDVETFKNYVKYMIEYGLTIEQIREAPSSSYCEMMLWHACSIAKSMNVPIHIIDRATVIDEELVNYYEVLGKEIGFSHVQFDYLKTDTVSEGGVPLVSKGVLQNDHNIPVVLVSVLFLKQIENE